MFSFLFSDFPPTPDRPIILNVTSTTATISWPEIPCNGGHDLQYFTIRIGSTSTDNYNYYYYYYFYIYDNGLSYNYINSIDARLKNYTIVGLTSDTNYDISLRAEGQDNTLSRFSRSVTITTLPPG